MSLLAAGLQGQHGLQHPGMPVHVLRGAASLLEKLILRLVAPATPPSSRAMGSEPGGNTDTDTPQRHTIQIIIILADLTRGPRSHLHQKNGASA